LLNVDLFAEDRAFEQFLPDLTRRVLNEQGSDCSLRIISARGGHPRVAKELDAYKSVIAKTGRLPDLLIVGVDSNCNGHTRTKQQYHDLLSDDLRNRAVIAAPDPHIERWFMCDQRAFAHVVGVTPALPAVKCDRDYYKHALEAAVIRAEQTVTLGGLEFGPEIVSNLDFYRAGKADGAIRSFIADLRTKAKELARA
jgi:hypothetical protein